MAEQVERPLIIASAVRASRCSLPQAGTESSRHLLLIALETCHGPAKSPLLLVGFWVPKYQGTIMGFEFANNPLDALGLEEFQRELLEQFQSKATILDCEYNSARRRAGG